jgi:glycosyltransferase involved in cell wall biosynthesis
MREDTPFLFAAFDVATLSSSYGEGFPNVLAEAMASGTPCVATDVGDAAQILGEVGLLVPPGQATKLAVAWLQLLAEPSSLAERRRLQARDRVEQNFSIAQMIAAYSMLYKSVREI